MRSIECDRETLFYNPELGDKIGEIASAIVWTGNILLSYAFRLKMTFFFVSGELWRGNM